MSSFSAVSLRAVLEAHLPAGATGLVIAISGGADSAYLLAAAAQLGGTFRGLPMRAVHVDHGLQAAAAEFRVVCAKLCEQLQIPLTVVSAVVDSSAGVSVEAAARDARYAALAAALNPGECLLTAHHCADQAETLLLQALRGAGLKGLSSMPVCRELGRGWHLRPLLSVAQRELHEFGAGLGLATAADPMNGDPRFDRAYLRRDIWPLTEKRWPGAGMSLARTAAHLAEAQELLDAAAAADVQRLRDGAALSLPGLRALGTLRRINAVRHWILSEAAVPPSTARLTEALRQVFEAEPDHLPAVVWGRSALRRYRDRLFLTEADPPRLAPAVQWSVRSGAVIDLGPGLGTLRWVEQSGGLDASRLSDGLCVRRRRGGETLKPGLHADTQSVQHLCQSLGVLPWMRDALPLIFAGDALVAIGDLWLDARWRSLPGNPGLCCVWDNAPIIV
jgi:tRNA(Ile)-lysidine synthase